MFNFFNLMLKRFWNKFGKFITIDFLLANGFFLTGSILFLEPVIHVIQPTYVALDLLLLLAVFYIFCWIITVNFKTYFFKTKWLAEDFKTLLWNEGEYVVPIGYLMNNILLLFIVALIFLYIYDFSFILASADATSSIYMSGLLIRSAKIVVIKISILLFYFFSLLFFNTVGPIYGFYRIEFTFVLGVNLFAALILVSSFNFIIWYVSLELFSLSLLLLIPLSSITNVDSYKSSLVYFTITVMGSIFVLIGITFIFGILGTFSFTAISSFSLQDFQSLEGQISISYEYSIKVSVFLIFLGLILKLGVVPYQIWVLSVYVHIPASIISFFLVCSKTVFFWLLYVLLHVLFFNVDFSVILVLGGFVTLLLSSNYLLTQDNIKLVFVIGSLFNTGTMLIALSVPGWHAAAAFFSYLIVDNFIFLLAFILGNSFYYVDKFSNINSMSDITMIARIKSPFLKFLLSTYLLSLAGFPPLIIFFFKVNFLQYVLLQHGVFFVFFYLLLSAINIFGYVRIIKNLWFLKPGTETNCFEMSSITLISGYYPVDDVKLLLNKFLLFLIVFVWFYMWVFYFFDYFTVIFSFAFSG